MKFLSFRDIRKEDVKIVADMAWPAILESFFVAFAGLVDSYMVSSLGAAAVASVGLTTQPKFLGLSLFMAGNVSISALVARRRGQGDKEDANRVFLTFLTFIVIAAFFLSGVFVTLADPIIRLCGSEELTHDGAVTYYQIIMGGMIFNVLQMGINSAQRGAGNTKITMRTNLVSNTINIVMNYLLIGGHFGFPALGIAGAAYATVLGTVVACFMSILSVLGDDNFVSLTYIFKEKIHASFAAFKSIVHVGYSVFIEQVLMRIGFMATAIMAADQGTSAMAAHQVGMNLMGLTFSFGDGLQATAVALIGRSLGAGKPEKAKLYGRICRIFGGGFSILLLCIYNLGARGLMGLFFEEEEIIAIGIQIMRVISVVCLFQIGQVVYAGSLRGAGDVRYTAFAATVSVTIVRTLGSYAFGYWLGLGIIGIWLGVVADQISRYLFMSIRFRQGKWTQIKI